MTKVTAESLVVGHEGREYTFADNKPLVDALSARYPFINFTSSLSLNNLSQFNLPIRSVDLQKGMLYDHISIREAVLDAIFDYFDAASERMHQMGIASADARLLRVEVEAKVSSTHLSTELTAKLYANFVTK